ncbi:MAG: FAD-dependent oxidoreductase, partial [Ilumatobacteraceae bacterium]
MVEPQHREMGAARTPIAWHVARWGDDARTIGSWSALAPGASPADRAALGRPIDGRVVLAGDATNPVAPSMTHGAFDEGVR